MNRIYKSLYSTALGTWIAVSELATGKSKSTVGWADEGSPSFTNTEDGLRFSAHPTLLTIALFALSNNAFALPTGNELVAGQATVSTPNATHLQIDQSSQRAVINWQGFSVRQNEAVTIQQPNAQAALLNRVVGQDASQIQGKLQANGQVYLTNPNGIIFSKTAQVDVGGLVATTHDITNQDFMNSKNHFSQNGATGKVENHGTINSTEGGVVALIGESVTNTGDINTPKGSTVLAAGKTVDLDIKGDGLVEVNVTAAALNAQIQNHGAITADGGRVVMTAKAANNLMDTVINQNGIVKARGMVERDGEIILQGNVVSQTGTLDVSGQTGGKITINAHSVLDAGHTNADGTQNKGGDIKITASDAIIQTAQANTHTNGKTQGGNIQLNSQNSSFSSGKLSATGETGGTINTLSNDRVVLAAAELDASGNTQGGTIRVGGDVHGTNPNIKNAKTTIVNGATKIKADGSNGKVVVWSDQQTDYYGNISANQQGDIEVSSKGTLTYAGMADAGLGGNLLLDPKNIIITANGGLASYELIDPHKATGNQFGSSVALLGTTVNGVFTENGNIVVSSPNDSFAATNAGAVYLFDITTGALKSTLTGLRAYDRIGSSGNNNLIALNNGNYVVSSPLWGNNKGAVTWGNGLTGISGLVSEANSLVGSIEGTNNSGDQLSSNGISALSNGNYVVSSSHWSNNKGAVTWGNGLTGTGGVISAANSLIGSIEGINSNGWLSGGDQIGNNQTDKNGITVLSNGNYVVSSSSWGNNKGAVTWGNGLTGTNGVISAANSLVGSIEGTNSGYSWLIGGDLIGSNGVTALSNGNYVVSSSSWSNNKGAVTWGNGQTGSNGIISDTNSLIGAISGDQLGSNGSIALNNGNYVISSPYWNKGKGAVTWGNGLTGISGTVSTANSLVGSIEGTTYFFGTSGSLLDGDQIGRYSITALSNGNYVVSSPQWGINKGAITWGNGLTGISGIVSATNSLVGSIEGTNYSGWIYGGDQVGSKGVKALINSNYVVISPQWAINKGAVTWGDGLTTTNGLISEANSLVGRAYGDQIGSNGVTALSNGNYVISSPHWNNNKGAATWGNGSTSVNGVISEANSLVGSIEGTVIGGDQIGFNYYSIEGITALSNGNYVVSSPYWNKGKGAVTWGNGLTGTSGMVSAENSLIGSIEGVTYSILANGQLIDGDQIGSKAITVLNNGNYVVSSPQWSNNKGAVTWRNGLIGINGIVNKTNSLIGSVEGNITLPLFPVGSGDQLCGYSCSVLGLSNGNYLVSSGYWDNTGLVNAGQVRVVTPQNINFADGLGQTMTLNSSMLSDTLALGTNVTLQANNDITLDVGSDINVSGSAGGKLTLQAGRNITLNSSISTANGDLLAVAGDYNANASDRDFGTPTLTLGKGIRINTGTGKVTLTANNGVIIDNAGSTTPIITKLHSDTATTLNNKLQDQLVPLSRSTTGGHHAHQLRWFYHHWLNDMFAKANDAGLFATVEHYRQASENEVQIINGVIKLPK